MLGMMLNIALIELAFVAFGSMSNKAPLFMLWKHSSSEGRKVSESCQNLCICG